MRPALILLAIVLTRSLAHAATFVDPARERAFPPIEAQSQRVDDPSDFF